MSCHDIGRGLNNVVRTVIHLYDEGKFDTDTARKIIYECARSVHWCDGNENEATDYIRRCRCGRCLKLVPEGGKLYSVWDVPRETPRRFDIVEDFLLASDGLCEECFDIVLNAHCKDDAAGERSRKFIEEHERPENYISTGEHEDNNNGYSWPTE